MDFRVMQTSFAKVQREMCGKIISYGQQFITTPLTLLAPNSYVRKWFTSVARALFASISACDENC